MKTRFMWVALGSGEPMGETPNPREMQAGNLRSRLASVRGIRLGRFWECGCECEGCEEKCCTEEVGDGGSESPVEYAGGDGAECTSECAEGAEKSEYPSLLVFGGVDAGECGEAWGGLCGANGQQEEAEVEYQVASVVSGEAYE